MDWCGKLEGASACKHRRSCLRRRLRDARRTLLCVVGAARCWLHVNLLFFFFQAEDGIRDDLVTGVQTCALPISLAQTQVLPDFTRLVDEQGNAVVNISTTQAVRRAALPQVPGIEDEEIQEFFRRFIPRQQPGPGQGPAPRSESRSLGSGFIISHDGYILTNAHVVEGADEINVKFTDKREFKAKVIGADKRTDVALIKIEGPSLPMVKFGDPARLTVGAAV